MALSSERVTLLSGELTLQSSWLPILNETEDFCIKVETDVGNIYGGRSLKVDREKDKGKKERERENNKEERKRNRRSKVDRWGDGERQRKKV